MNEVNATLVIMAAGIGSRYSDTESKQLAVVDDYDRTLMEYSIYDAISVGFNRVIFIIREEMQEYFSRIGDKLPVKVDYVYQYVNRLSPRFKHKFHNRTKPWGTAYALAVCGEIVSENETVVTINADDFYGIDAFVKSYEFIKNNPGKIGLTTYNLKNTLSDNGGVTRGVCTIKNGMLETIKEVKNIVRTDTTELCEDSQVSMNMWIFNKKILGMFHVESYKFFSGLDNSDNKSEFIITDVINDLLKSKSISVNCIPTSNKWFGMTFKEDLEFVKKNISELIRCGFYPKEFNYIKKGKNNNMQKLLLVKNDNTEELDMLLDSGWVIKEFKPISNYVTSESISSGNVYTYVLLIKEASRKTLHE